MRSTGEEGRGGEGGGRRFEVGAPRRFSGAWKNVGPFARGGLLMGV